MIINTNLIYLNVKNSLDKISGSSKLEDNSNRELYDDLYSSILSDNAEIKNFNGSIGFLQIADSSLNQLSKQSDKISELLVSKNSGILNNDQLSGIDSQISKIRDNMQKIIDDSSYNGINVFHTGSLPKDLNLNLDVKEIDFNDMDSVKEFQKQLNEARSQISSVTHKSLSEISNLSKKIVNESASKNNYEVDYADEVSKFKDGKVKLELNSLVSAHNFDSLKLSVNQLLG